MFTGIVEATAEVLSNENGKLRIARPTEFDDLKIGASIAVSGVCLTLVGITKGSMDFDVIEETMARSTMGEKKPGDIVNLERAMPAGGRLDGHVVQGHVEGVGVVMKMGQVTSDMGQPSKKKPSDVPCPMSHVTSSSLVIQLPSQLSKNVIHKGSIAIDGVSLTVANIDQNLCSVALIPHTKKSTRLGSVRIGDRVNIETDILQRSNR